MAAKKQDRRLAVAGSEPEAPHSGLIGRLHIGGDASERTFAQSIIGHGKHVGLLFLLRIRDSTGAKTDLLQPWRVEIEPRESSQLREAGLRCEPRRDPGGE